MGVEVQGRVDEYLLRLDSALTRRGASPAQRRSLGLETRAKIVQKLTARAPATLRPNDVLHLPSADIDAVLAEVGTPEKHALEFVPAHKIIQRYTGPKSLSKAALLGALWAPLFALMFILSGIQLNILPGESPPWWYNGLQYSMLPLGWSAPLATTVLGLLAIGRIQKSNGRVYGMSLAVFDSLVFPLLLIDFIVFKICWQLNSQLLDQQAISEPVAKLITQIIPTVACVLGDYFLVARAWMAVQKDE